ncbi:MAG TPA: prolipoprotein diacylglyceryl transferase [Candidatus Bathyarchaeia archaeon]|nr:prolipoprotein diacylglyceryl transferase [Candidatus Bathyarchaeia archaeon]
MRYQLLHIYGPFAIHSYGLCIALGLLIFIILVQYHPLFKKLQLQQKFLSIVVVGVLIGIIGGRALHIMTETDSLFDMYTWISWWEGGYSILGTVLALFLCLPLYLRCIQVPVLPFFDLIALYTPLIQAISRIGCFFAGCCHGMPTEVAWAVAYTDPLSMAPQYVLLHPTQLYSAGVLFCMFLVFYFYVQYQVQYTGQLTSLYLIFEGAERFTIDFWRANRPMMGTIFSADQYIAGGIIVLGCALLWYSTYYRRKQTAFLPSSP